MFLDVLRGFALLGILIVNLGLFAFGMDQPRGTGRDRAAEFVVTWLFTGKFYVLFSFLFGYGLALAAGRALHRGRSITAPWTRRLITLFLMGVAHGILLFQGDILTCYGLMGLVLLAAHRVSPRTAVITGVTLIGVSAAMLGLIMAVLAFANLGEDPVTSSYEAWRGGFADVVGERAADYGLLQGLGLPFIYPGVLGVFFLGLAAAKHGLLTDTSGLSTQRLRRLTIIGLAVGLPGGLVSALGEAHQGRGWWALGPFVAELTAPSLTLAYVCLLLLAVRTTAGARVLTRLAPAGRMALTNYLTQSVICAFLFTGYGFGLIGRVPAAWFPLIALGIWGTQLVLSDLYFRRFTIGPVEAALRTVTYLRVPRLTSPPPPS